MLLSIIIQKYWRLTVSMIFEYAVEINISNNFFLYVYLVVRWLATNTNAYISVGFNSYY